MNFGVLSSSTFGMVHWMRQIGLLTRADNQNLLCIKMISEPSWVVPFTFLASAKVDHFFMTAGIEPFSSSRMRVCDFGYRRLRLPVFPHGPHDKPLPSLSGLY